MAKRTRESQVVHPFPVSGREPLFHGHNQRRPFRDDIGCQFRCQAAANIPRGMRRACRDEQRFACLQRHRRLIAKPILKAALQYMGNLFTRVRVPGRECARFKVYAHLNAFLARNAELMADQVGPMDSRRLCVGVVYRCGEAGDGHGGGGKLGERHLGVSFSGWDMCKQRIYVAWAALNDADVSRL
ncbi:conserved protein of unknown function [Cupriavidus neocaledonicus]|uniref:Uncharacterized protein n=1 Tax=Cupriavidus neocaledonicus TaxID=1040979 RepID=A0A375H7G1_9BURK|nr:hypothetical protein CBM2605_A100066 [Cupriavidus neocaledonicus]SPD46423.1 conserved protein of unknown function [Cupriavidus neocaledonicus]